MREFESECLAHLVWCQGTSLEDVVEWSITEVNATEESSLLSAKRRLYADARKEPGENASDWAKDHVARWDQLPMKPEAVLSQQQREYLFAVEVVYMDVLRSVNAAILQWRKRVGLGKIVASFGQRVQTLTRSSQDEFSARTTEAAAMQERVERLRMLSDYIRRIASTLYDQQVAIISSEVIRAFKKRLPALCASAVPVHIAEEAVRQSVSEFQSRVEELGRGGQFSLVAPGHDVTAAADGSGLSESLQQLLVDYPDSPAGKLSQLREMEALARRSSSSKKKGGRGINPSLSLVGMLRLPGTGNLQGLVGYGARLFGLPVDLLLGVDNNSDDSLEVW